MLCPAQFLGAMSSIRLDQHVRKTIGDGRPAFMGGAEARIIAGHDISCPYKFASRVDARRIAAGAMRLQKNAGWKPACRGQAGATVAGLAAPLEARAGSGAG